MVLERKVYNNYRKDELVFSCKIDFGENEPSQKEIDKFDKMIKRFEEGFIGDLFPNRFRGDFKEYITNIKEIFRNYNIKVLDMQINDLYANKIQFLYEDGIIKDYIHVTNEEIHNSVATKFIKQFDSKPKIFVTKSQWKTLDYDENEYKEIPTDDIANGPKDGMPYDKRKLANIIKCNVENMQYIYELFNNLYFTREEKIMIDLYKRFYNEVPDFKKEEVVLKAKAMSSIFCFAKELNLRIPKIFLTLDFQGRNIKYDNAKAFEIIDNLAKRDKVPRKILKEIDYLDKAVNISFNCDHIKWVEKEIQTLKEKYIELLEYMDDDEEETYEYICEAVKVLLTQGCLKDYLKEHNTDKEARILDNYCYYIWGKFIYIRNGLEEFQYRGYDYDGSPHERTYYYTKKFINSCIKNAEYKLKLRGY